MNCICRRYRGERLYVRKRKARRRTAGTRAPILFDTWSTARWSIEFVNDQFACARRFRILTAVDEVTGECLTAIPDTSISSRRVAPEFTTVIAQPGRTSMIVLDHGTTLRPKSGPFRATVCRQQVKHVRAGQLLLGHTKLESTVRYLGVDVDDALEISTSIDL